MREDVCHGVVYGGRGLEASSVTITGVEGKIGEMHTSEDSATVESNRPDGPQEPIATRINRREVK